MVSNMDKKMEEYAELLVTTGANVQKGQPLVISCPVDCADLARLCAEKAYDLGAKEVSVIWGDDNLSRMKYLRAEDSIFDEMPEWQGMMYDNHVDTRSARLHISGSDPEALMGVDPMRIQRFQQAAGKRLENYNEAQMRNEFQWCIGAYAAKPWAKKVFPDRTEDEAVERLWDAIFTAVRVEGDGRATEKWADFLITIEKRLAILNGYRFKYLKYKNSLGTDLTVELPEGHIWTGVGERCTGVGVDFIANMPSEEVFTAPHRDGINGVVYASKPLVLSGNLIKDLRFTLKDGKIIEAAAEQGEDFLKKSIETDEGAAYFGEVALVPHDSPISNTGILFYNTLFDENASCHFAFGKAYPTCVAGTEGKSKEELIAMGVNDSFVHEDFMVGTPDLSITGVKGDGTEIPVFTDGNFVF